MGDDFQEQPDRMMDGEGPRFGAVRKLGHWFILKYVVWVASAAVGAAGLFFLASERAWMVAAILGGTIALYMILQREADTTMNLRRNKIVGKLSDALPIMVYQCRYYPNGRCTLTYSNTAIRWIYELDHREVKKDCSPILNLVHPEDRERVEKSLWESALHLTPWVGEYRVVLPKQGVRWRFAHARVERLLDGSTLWNGFIMDNTAQKEAQDRLRMAEQRETATLRAARRVEEKKMKLLTRLNEKLHRESTHDHLTGVYLRRHFDRRYPEIFEQARQEHQPLTLVLCDVDFFKKYNDSFGHMAGDHALSTVARTLNEQINRKDQFLARYGGEEFVAVLPGLGLDRSIHVAEQLRQSVEALGLRAPSGGGEVVTISVGVICVDEVPPGLTAADFLHAADAALYKAKHSGRNCVRLGSLEAPKDRDTRPPQHEGNGSHGGFEWWEKEAKFSPDI